LWAPTGLPMKTGQMSLSKFREVWIKREKEGKVISSCSLLPLLSLSSLGLKGLHVCCVVYGWYSLFIILSAHSPQSDMTTIYRTYRMKWTRNRNKKYKNDRNYEKLWTKCRTIKIWGKRMKNFHCHIIKKVFSMPIVIVDKTRAELTKNKVKVRICAIPWVLS